MTAGNQKWKVAPTYTDSLIVLVPFLLLDISITAVSGGYTLGSFLLIKPTDKLAVICAASPVAATFAIIITSLVTNRSTSFALDIADMVGRNSSSEVDVVSNVGVVNGLRG